MILECSACHARFTVADGMIPAEGRTVRCGKCAHEWFVAAAVSDATVVEAPVEAPTMDVFEEALAALADEAAPAVPEPVAPSPPKVTNLPVLARAKGLNPKPFKIAVPLLAALWLLLAFITYFPSWAKAPGLSGIYHALGSTPTEGLVFADVHMEREEDEGKTRFVLSGSIRNQASEARLVPTVRVVLRNKENKSLWSREYAVNTELKAGEVYPFRIANVETAFAKSVSSIVVDVGNGLQLMVR